jgi:hypothetical protein
MSRIQVSKKEFTGSARDYANVFSILPFQRDGPKPPGPVPVPALAGIDYTKQYELMRSNSVSIFTQDLEGRTALASGFFTRDIGSDKELLIATCAHNVFVKNTESTPLPYIMVAFYTATTPSRYVWAGVDVIAVDVAHDLAILKIQPTWLVPEQVEGIKGLTFYVPSYVDNYPNEPTMSFKTGMPLIMCGFTMGIDQFSFTHGWVREAMGSLDMSGFAPDTFSSKIPSFLAMINAAPGNSGSCVILPLENNKVAGILYGGNSLLGAEVNAVTHPMTTKLTLDRMYAGWLTTQPTLFTNVPRFFNISFYPFGTTPLIFDVESFYSEADDFKGFNQNATTVFFYDEEGEEPIPGIDSSLGPLKRSTIPEETAYVANGEIQNVIRITVVRGGSTVSYSIGLEAPYMNLLFMQWLIFEGETPTIFSYDLLSSELRNVVVDQEVTLFAMPPAFRLNGFGFTQNFISGLNSHPALRKRLQLRMTH